MNDNGKVPPMIFISHSTTDKLVAATFKEKLGICGLDAFVAHEDIGITEPWKEEIKRNLEKCDALLVIVTERSKVSVWVNQEIGCAIMRGIPIFSIIIGTEPFGFLSDYQGIPLREKHATGGGWSYDFDECLKSIITTSMKKAHFPSTVKNYIIDAINRCSSFKNGQLLFEIIEELEASGHLSLNDIEEIFVNSSFNGQVYGSFGARRSLQRLLDKYNGKIHKDVENIIRPKIFQNQPHYIANTIIETVKYPDDKE